MRLLLRAAAPAARATASSVNASMSPPPELPLPEAPAAPPLALEPPVVSALTGGDIMTCAVPERAVSAADTAVTVTVAGEGTVVGAAYNPRLEIVPTEIFPPAMPFTCQVTAVLEAFATEAANICDPDAATTVAFEGLTDTVIIGETVTCAEAVLVVSAPDTAVTVTVAGDGTAAGAV